MNEPRGKRGKYFVTRPDGSKVIMRPAYEPRDFMFPQRELDHFGDFRSGYGTEDVLDEYDGELSYYRQIRRFERDGKRWILLQHATEYAVEVELTRGEVGEVHPLSPEDAWDLARELDLDEKRYPIELEPGSELP